MADIKATQTNNSDEWGTPPWLLRLLEEEFGTIDLDPASTPENRVAGSFYTKEFDGLSPLRPWFGITYVNPPYSEVGKWAEKSYQEAKASRATVLLLCAARPDTRYWWDFIRHGEVRFIKGRIRFVGANNSAPFPSALVVFHRGLYRTASTVYWDIPKEKRE